MVYDYKQHRKFMDSMKREMRNILSSGKTPGKKMVEFKKLHKAVEKFDAVMHTEIGRLEHIRNNAAQIRYWNKFQVEVEAALNDLANLYPLHDEVTAFLAGLDNAMNTLAYEVGTEAKAQRE